MTKRAMINLLCSLKSPVHSSILWGVQGCWEVFASNARRIITAAFNDLRKIWHQIENPRVGGSIPYSATISSVAKPAHRVGFFVCAAFVSKASPPNLSALTTLPFASSRRSFPRDGRTPYPTRFSCGNRTTLERAMKDLPDSRGLGRRVRSMFSHNKRLQYTVRVSESNPALANLLLEQFGGPQGELAAAMRYFTQAIGEEDAGRKDMLMDISTEELSHLEVVGCLVGMLNRGAKGQLAEATQSEADLFRSLQGAGNDSHVTQVLYGGGPALINSAGVPWSGAYVDSIGDPTADLRSNIAAEARAKIVYERLINLTTDPGVKDALTFLMTREIAHQKSFEKALYAIEGHFPPGKLPGDPRFTNAYMDMSHGKGDARGPWNEGPEWTFVTGGDEQKPVDGDGSAKVELSGDEREAIKRLAERTASDPSIDPLTGAELDRHVAEETE